MDRSVHIKGADNNHDHGMPQCPIPIPTAAVRDSDSSNDGTSTIIPKKTAIQTSTIILANISVMYETAPTFLDQTTIIHHKYMYNPQTVTVRDKGNLTTAKKHLLL